jgi:hypothetical protein
LIIIKNTTKGLGFKVTSLPQTTEYLPSVDFEGEERDHNIYANTTFVNKICHTYTDTSENKVSKK